jgi:large subunit ribosomal protein L15
VGDLDEKLEEFMKQGFAVKQDGKVKINLANMGVDKLLGFGKVSNIFDIVVAESSARAKEKLEAAGGSVAQP